MERFGSGTWEGALDKQWWRDLASWYRMPLADVTPKVDNSWPIGSEGTLPGASCSTCGVVDARCHATCSSEKAYWEVVRLGKAHRARAGSKRNTHPWKELLEFVTKSVQDASKNLVFAPTPPVYGPSPLRSVTGRWTASQPFVDVDYASAELAIIHEIMKIDGVEVVPGARVAFSMGCSSTPHIGIDWGKEEFVYPWWRRDKGRASVRVDDYKEALYYESLEDVRITLSEWESADGWSAAVKGSGDEMMPERIAIECYHDWGLIPRDLEAKFKRLVTGPDEL